MSDSQRPSIMQLLKDFQELGSFLQVGNKYGVSDNTVRKWCTIYQIPIHTKELKEYIANFNNPDYVLIKSERKPKKVLDHQKIISDYQSGLSIKETAELNNCDQTSIRNILNRYNIPRHKNVVPVSCFDNELEIQTFESIEDATNWVLQNQLSNGNEKTIRSFIRAVCNGKRPKAYGYFWKYI